MDRVTELADLVRPRDGLRVVGGRVVQVVDSSHVLVDLGDKAVTAFGSAPVGADVRLMVGGGVVELIPAPPTPVPYRMASGSATLTFSGSATASVAISFPAGRFTLTPRWMAWLRTQELGIVIAATSETTSGATIRGATGGGAPYTGSVSVGWLAWQMSASDKDF